MATIGRHMARMAAFAGEVVSETLWPTRCAVCDVPGAVLCKRCAATLPYLDWWRACPTCGAAFGLRQCHACNSIVLDQLGRDTLPYRSCASATMFSASTGQIVRVYKDQGEQRLAADMAPMMARVVPPDWTFDAVTFVPATRTAFRRRGFDHAELLAARVADELCVRLVHALERPITRDQRKLTGAERVANLAGSFRARPHDVFGASLLLVDDVYTTGATLCSATDALMAAGATDVRCLTFARV